MNGRETLTACDGRLRSHDKRQPMNGRETLTARDGRLRSSAQCSSKCSILSSLANGACGVRGRHSVLTIPMAYH